MKLITKLIPVFLLVGVFGLYQIQSPPKAYAAPATFTVTNNNDSGAGSLRSAIESANANNNPSDQDTIEFNISGSGSHRIELLSDITISEPLKIDGFTQTDSILNTAPFPEPFDNQIRIELMMYDASLLVQSNNSEVKGISMFMRWGVPVKSLLTLINADDFTLTGSNISTTHTGLDSTVSSADQVSAISITDSDNVRIGGSLPAERNIFGTCGYFCIEGFTDSGTTNGLIIQGNNFNMSADGISPYHSDSFPFPGGILLHPGITNVTIGGSGSGEGNMFYYLSGALFATNVSGMEIKGNNFFRNTNLLVGADSYYSTIQMNGVTDVQFGEIGAGANLIGGSYSQNLISIADSDVDNAVSSAIDITGNTFGLNYDQSANLTNYSTGINISGATNNVHIDSNVMRNGQGNTVILVDDTARKIAITGNEIYDNTTGVINLDDTGNNDALDVDTGANDRLNSPGYTGIVEDGGNTEVTYTIDVPAGEYRIEFFSNSDTDPGGNKEAESYIGFDTITSTGTGLQEFAVALSGTGFTHMTLTATEIDPSTPSGFGSTSQLGTVGQVIDNGGGGGGGGGDNPVVDKALKMQLLNPEDFGLGNTLNYRFTILNTGPDPLDISLLNEVGSENGLNLASGILHPSLTFLSATGDVACAYAGDGSATLAGSFLTNHSDHGLLNCGYSGTSPRVLQAGQSFSFTVQTEVTDDSNPDFSVYGFSSPAAEDPDSGTMLAIFIDGLELIDTASQYPFNNFAKASSTVNDLSASVELNNPQNMSVGGTAEYTYTLTNNGGSAFDPRPFDLGGSNPLVTSLFTVLLPPNLTYVSQNNPDINCAVAGPASIAQTLFADSLDHTLIVCGYYGSVSSIPVNGTLSMAVSAQVNTIPSSFSAHFGAALSQYDPDLSLIQSNLYRGKDLVTSSAEQGINNFDTTTFLASNDFDNDGIADLVEDAIAPNGDGNGDSIDDKLQDSVASAINPVSNSYVTLEVAGDCGVISNFSVGAEVDQSAQDSAHSYPLGLNDFEITCTNPGDSANVKFYYDKQYDTSSWTIRKLLGSNYTDLSSAVIGSATVNNASVTTISYSIADGSPLDEDTAANGTIVDPSGPGVAAAGGTSNAGGNLATTGQNMFVIIPLATLFVSLVILVILAKRDNKGAKKILAAASRDPKRTVIIAGVVAVVVGGGFIAYGIISPDKKTERKVIYDGREQIQDINEGLVNIPKDATSFVCDKVTSAKLAEVTKQQFNTGRVSIPTTKTSEGQTSACAYTAKDPQSASMASIIITQRQFNTPTKASESYGYLTKITNKNRKSIGDTAFYDSKVNQLIALKESTISTVSIVANKKEVPSQTYTDILKIL